MLELVPIDSRLKLLSHSSVCLLHSCPRQYQLTKLWPTYDREDTVHTVYGSMFGEGVQSLLAGRSLQDSLLTAAVQWTIGLDEFLKEKSFWHCWQAIERFHNEMQSNALSDYEMVYFNGKPACELSFCITLPYGFYYRGFIDCVLQHRLTGEYLVVDLKTTGAKFTNSAKYQNSAQVIGYSIVMDAIAPGTQSFMVMYYEFLTTVNRFESHEFVVDIMDRAIWLKDLKADLDIAALIYAPLSEWPKHGEHCLTYNRPCKFLDICNLRTEHIVDMREPILADALSIDSRMEVGGYDINVSFADLIAAQLELLAEE